MDVVRTLYRDLTGAPVYLMHPREGRKWVIEDFDIVSSLHYHWEGALALKDWLSSFKGVEEGAWFSWRDPVPFVIMVARMMKKSAVWIGKRLGVADPPSAAQNGLGESERSADVLDGSP